MYCPKCKTEVGNMQFCENCGAATVGELKKDIPGAAGEIAAAADAAAPRPGITIKVPEFSLKRVIALCAVLVVLIAAFVGFSKLKALSTPEAFAEKYASLLIEGDTDKAFGILDIEENEFLSKTNFKKYIDSLELQGKELKEVRPVKEMNQFYGMFGQEAQKDPAKAAQQEYYEVQINTDVYGLTMVQQGKSFGIFPGWKVQASDFTKEWQIVSPKGSIVSVDGVQIERVEKSQDSGFGFGMGNYKPEKLTYSIPGIFPGEYEIVATMEGAEEFKTTAIAGQMTNIKFIPSEATITELQQAAKNFLDLAYSKAEKGKYSGILSPDSSLMQQEKIAIIGGFGFYYPESAVSKLDSVEVVKDSGVIDDLSHAKLQVKANYSVTYDERVSWFSDETKQVTKQNTDNHTFSFVKKDGKWFILELGY